MGQPVDPAAACVCSASTDFLNECPANAFAARRFDGEQILQVARWLNGNCAAMEEVVYQAEDLTRLLRDQCMNGLVTIEETRPCAAGDFVGEGRRILAAIERVVTVPEMLPLLEVIFSDLVDEKFW